MIEVVRAGAMTTVQDMGRPGLAHLGVPGSGAADRVSLALANRLVGNQVNAAGLEFTLGAAELLFLDAAWIAVTGAPVQLTVEGRAEPCNAACYVRAGEHMRLGHPTRGLRSYLAVRGGVDVEPVLGSRSTDLLSGVGPAPLTNGIRLPVGNAAGEFPDVDIAATAELLDEPVLRVIPGPRDDWFEPSALHTLVSTPYTVTPKSNRVGVRLKGPSLRRSRDGELLSEGMVTGALQVPPDGQPILFLADHPTTGGYPVIAVVHSADHHLAAQLRPGQTVRFRAVR